MAQQHTPDRHTQRLLMTFAEQSTARIEREQWRYYFEADGLKFYNSHLADWYQRHSGSWVRFVVSYLPEVRQELSGASVDPDHDYDLDHLRRLTASQPVTLFLSGGNDSIYVLDKAQRHGLPLRETVSHVFGQHLSHPVNQEIRDNAIPCAQGSPYPHRIIHHTLDFLEECYLDPWYFLRCADFGGCAPAFRRMYDQIARERCDGIWLFGPDKPELVSLRGRWYSVLYPSHVFDHAPLVPKNSECLNRGVGNIKSRVRDAMVLRRHIIAGGLQEPRHTCFYKAGPSSAVLTDIGRRPPPRPAAQHDKATIGTLLWPNKEQCAIQHAIQQQRFRLMQLYMRALGNLVSVASPAGAPDDLNRGASRFGWFIDLDSLEVYTQEQLIPGGFPDADNLVNRTC